ncbi:MAG: DUF732 domain-containing protein [Lawsonella sp.]|nr:DUF732 domain-containing protein [Mycobacteriales bacterium]
MTVYNLDAVGAVATLKTQQRIVAVKHEDDRRGAGKTVEIPVGAIRSAEWKRTPKEGKTKKNQLRFYFRNIEHGIPKSFDTGIFTVETTKQNLKFVEKLNDAISETEPIEDWQQPLNYEKLQKRSRKLMVVKILAAVLVLALIIALIVVGVKKVNEPPTASEQAAVLMQDMDPEVKADLFRNSLLTMGIKAKPESAKKAALAVCKQFDKGASFGEVGMALILAEKSMTAYQKGQFIASSVTWWCPQHADELK